MLLKGRGREGQFTYRISRAKYNRILVWLSEKAKGNRPDCLKTNDSFCTFWGGHGPLCELGCLLDKLFDGGCCSEQINALLYHPENKNAVRNARRRLLRMAKRGEEEKEEGK